METKFKSVIFFMATNPRNEPLKLALQGSLIKVFQAGNFDEIKQIMSMSSKTAIIVDNQTVVPLVLKEGMLSKRDLIRRYYVDWDNLLDDNTFDNQGITLIRSSEIPLIIEKLELYLFGKVNIFNKKEFIEPKTENHPLGKAFFTHLERTPSGWKILISSHEKENNMSEILGQDWDKLLKNILVKANGMTSPWETKLTQKPFYQIVYPHLQDGELKKMSVVHLEQDAKAEESVLRVLTFLATI